MNLSFKINYTNQSIFRSWWPIFPALVFWLIAISNYHFGLVYYDYLRPNTYLYLLSFFALTFLGYALGVKFSSEKYPLRRTSSPYVVPEKIFFISLVLTLFGLFLFLFDRLFISGITISRVVEETAAIRDETDLTLITTLGSPFAGFQLVLLALYFHKVFLKQRVKFYIHFLVAITVFLRLFLSFISTNRMAFIFVLGWVLYLIFFITGSRLRTFLALHKRIFLKICIISFGISTFFYVILISRFRTDENYLYHSTKSLDDRYGLREYLDPQMANAVLSLSTYSTQQFLYIDRGLELANPFVFKPQSMLTFFLRQLMKVGIYAPFYRYYVDEQERRVEMNFFATGWPSLPGIGLFIFGYIGFPIFMFIICLIFGYSSLQFIRTGSLVSLSWNFFFYNYALITHMGIPSDQYYSILLIFALLCPLIARGNRITLVKWGYNPFGRIQVVSNL